VRLAPVRLSLLALSLAIVACSDQPSSRPAAQPSRADSLLAQYTTVRLTADLAALSENERRMIPLLIEAADAMDEVFWFELSGPRDSVLPSIADTALRRYAAINYGPWDQLAGNAPFVPGVGPKPPGANFYPHDITRAEFDSAVAGGGKRGDSLRSPYTLVRRSPAGLVPVPYHVAFAPQHGRAAAKLREAAALAGDPGLRRYLDLRARALETDDYQPSDFAWMAMKGNVIDVVIGPIETYEDQLYGYKAAHEAFVLVKDRDWSSRLARYATVLPELQRGLPVPARYRRETPGADADLNAYDVVYYAGDANAGSKTIAINLPNDEQVQLRAGTRRLQLKNAVKAKFDRIMTPIAGALIAGDQRAHVTFDAFFENVMFHEVAHGLGIKNTVNGRGTVRSALKEQANTVEEGKADVLGLFMVTELMRRGELDSTRLRDNYTTFIASIFRSIRFGATSAHGRANVARFNYFERLGAFSRDSATGTYRVDYGRMGAAMDSLSARLLTFQGDGDYDGVSAFMAEYGTVSPTLQADLDRLATLGIPVDVVFEQGPSVLGLPKSEQRTANSE
jgi:hypothetical protein